MTFRPSRGLNIAVCFMAVARWAVLPAEVVIRLEVPTNTIVTITVSAASQVTVATNIARAVPDARRSLPRAIPTPPVPFYVDAKRPFEATFVRPLPGGTNRSYSQHMEALAEKASKGLRRSE